MLPGLGGSGPAHWQSRWEARQPGRVRVEQADWDAPALEDWARALEAAVRAHLRVVLVAHSLACQLVAHWARSGAVERVAAALLVSPPDVERADLPAAVRPFAPIPRERLPFRSWVVASSDDPYSSPERTRAMAEGWGARLIEAGPLGHINTDSGHGDWRDGEALLDAIVACAGRRSAPEPSGLPRAG
ncbi:MAG: alpha/beta hydrolase [Anaeromyxobacter sp.]